MVFNMLKGIRRLMLTTGLLCGVGLFLCATDVKAAVSVSGITVNSGDKTATITVTGDPGDSINSVYLGSGIDGADLVKSAQISFSEISFTADKSSDTVTIDRDKIWKWRVDKEIYEPCVLYANTADSSTGAVSSGTMLPALIHIVAKDYDDSSYLHLHGEYVISDTKSSNPIGTQGSTAEAYLYSGEKFQVTPNNIGDNYYMNVCSGSSDPLWTDSGWISAADKFSFEASSDRTIEFSYLPKVTSIDFVSGFQKEYNYEKKSGVAITKEFSFSDVVVNTADGSQDSADIAKKNMVSIEISSDAGTPYLSGTQTSSGYEVKCTNELTSDREETVKLVVNRAGSSSPLTFRIHTPATVQASYDSSKRTLKVTTSNRFNSFRVILENSSGDNLMETENINLQTTSSGTKEYTLSADAIEGLVTAAASDGKFSSDSTSVRFRVIPRDSSGDAEEDLQRKTDITTVYRLTASGTNFNTSSAYGLNGQTVILTAYPNSGYAFDKWSDGNTSNPREVVVSSAGTKTFTAVSKQAANPSDISPSNTKDAIKNANRNFISVEKTMDIAELMKKYLKNDKGNDIGSDFTVTKIDKSGSAADKQDSTKIKGVSAGTVKVDVYFDNSSTPAIKELEIEVYPKTPNPTYSADDRKLKGKVPGKIYYGFDNSDNIRDVNSIKVVLESSSGESLADKTFDISSSADSGLKEYSIDTSEIENLVATAASNGKFSSDSTSVRFKVIPRGKKQSGDDTIDAKEESQVKSDITTVYRLTASGTNFGTSYAYGLNGQTVKLTASPNSGYTFEKWSDGNTSNPREIKVSSSGTKTFTAIAKQSVNPTNGSTTNGVNGNGTGTNGDNSQLYDDVPKTAESNSAIWLIVFMVFAVMGTTYALYLQLRAATSKNDR